MKSREGQSRAEQDRRQQSRAEQEREGGGWVATAAEASGRDKVNSSGAVVAYGDP